MRRRPSDTGGRCVGSANQEQTPSLRSIWRSGAIYVSLHDDASCMLEEKYGRCMQIHKRSAMSFAVAVLQ